MLETAVRQQVNVPQDNPIYSMITRIYSTDNVTEEYVLADARLQCAMLFLFEEDDGTRKRTGSSVNNNLPAEEWIAACSKQEWINKNRKIKGEGTLLSIWNRNPTEAKDLAEYFWPKKDLINMGEFSIEDALDDPLASLTDFKKEIIGASLACVTTRIWNEANP